MPVAKVGIAECRRCKSNRRIAGRGCCARCYQTEKRAERKRQYEQNPARYGCVNCGSGPQVAKGLCNRCYREYHGTGGAPKAQPQEGYSTDRLGNGVLGICIVSPDCFTCPLPVCRYDGAEGAAALRKWARGKTKERI